MKVKLSPWSKAVKKAMIDKDMQLKDLAAATGFSIQHVSSIVNSKRLGCIEAEKKISEAVGVEYPYTA